MTEGNHHHPAEGPDKIPAEKGGELMSGRDGGIINESNDELRKSVQLLLLLSRTEFTGEEKLQITAAFGSFTSWQLLSSLAVRHGVAALVWQNISDLGLDGMVPETERILLEGLRFKSIARVSWISEAAAGVTSLLEREGIRVVLLKGLALEHTVYGSKGLRQMSDADLLVTPADAFKARDILMRYGFRSMSLKSPLYRHIILDLGNHLPELHRGGVSVDLHHRLFGPEGEAMVARAIAESEPVAPGRDHFRVLPPMIAFLALVGHIYKHEVKGEFQLRLWVDIYLLLGKYGNRIMTEALPAAAKEAGLESETRIVLTVMEQVWGIPILPELREPGTDRASGFMHDLMHPGSVVPISQREFFARNLKSLKSPGKRLIFILGDIFPSIGFMKRRYGCRNAARALLFYPHRMGKLAWILGHREAKNPDI
jgi:hypothetical protein